MSNDFEGHCHCGSVQFKAAVDLEKTFKCNCSFCVRRAATLARVPEQAFELKSDEDEMGKYGSRSFSDHYFCQRCGVHCYTRFQNEKGKAVIVNVGCLDGVDSHALTPAIFDGATKL